MNEQRNLQRLKVSPRRIIRYYLDRSGWPPLVAEQNARFEALKGRTL